MTADIKRRIVVAARACLGTPFRHQGRAPGVGLDCAGLAVVALQSAGVEVRDYRGYGRIPNDGRLRRAIDEQPGLESVPVDKAEPGDVLLLRFAGVPAHIGILTAPGIMIHAYEQIGRVVEHRIDEAWRGQIVAAWSVRGEA